MAVCNSQCNSHHPTHGQRCERPSGHGEPHDSGEYKWCLTDQATDAYYLAMAALDTYEPLWDPWQGAPKSTSVVYRIDQLGHTLEAALATVRVLSTALKLAGDEIHSEYCTSERCHAACVSVTEALNQAGG